MLYKVSQTNGVYKIMDTSSGSILYFTKERLNLMINQVGMKIFNKTDIETLVDFTYKYYTLISTMDRNLAHNFLTGRVTGVTNKCALSAKSLYSKLVSSGFTFSLDYLLNPTDLLIRDIYGLYFSGGLNYNECAFESMCYATAEKWGLSPKLFL